MKRSKRKPAPVARPVRGLRWPIAAIVLAGALTYANSLSGPFVFDDRGTVLDNATIESLRDPDVFSAPAETPAAGRPVVNVSFAVNYALGGRDVRGYHIGNIAIHLLCALLIFAVVRRALQLAGHRQADGPAFAVAIIWTVHPLNSEAVNYLTQRTESLMAVFYLLTLYASLRVMEAPRAPAWSAIAVLSCALGMASKESMVTAPVVVLVFDRVFVSGSFSQALRARWRLYAGLAAAWAVLALLLAGAPRTLSAGFTAHDAAPWTYLLNQAVMVTRYLRLAVWPSALTLYYGWPLPLTFGEVWPQALFVTSLLLLTVVALIRAPRLGFLGFWFFVTLAPTSSIVPIATEVGAERRMYLPLIAVTAALVMLVYRAIGRWEDRIVGESRHRATWRPALVAIAVSVLLAIGTVSRNREYRSSLTLAETTLERWPTPAAHSMLGMELAAVGRFAEAESHLRAAAPVFPPARYYLATVLARNGNAEEAIAQVREFIRQQPPGLDQVHLARGLMADLFMQNGRWTDAIEQYRLMLSARPADTEARRLLAAALVRDRSYGEAVEQYRRVLADRPDDVSALGGLGIALASLGRMDEAIAVFRRAVELDPGNVHAQQNLARAMEMR